jgi:hypothetical protein
VASPRVAYAISVPLLSVARASLILREGSTFTAAVAPSALLRVECFASRPLDKPLPN